MYESKPPRSGLHERYTDKRTGWRVAAGPDEEPPNFFKGGTQFSDRLGFAASRQREYRRRKAMCAPRKLGFEEVDRWRFVPAFVPASRANELSQAVISHHIPPVRQPCHRNPLATLMLRA